MTARRRFIQFCALVLLAATSTVRSAAAETTTAPAALPAWPDEVPSVYSQPLKQVESTVAPAIESPPTAAPPDAVDPASFVAPPVAEPVVEIAAKPIATPVEKDARRLAPRRRDTGKKASTDFTTEAIPSFGLKFDSIYTTGAALAIVLGVFFFCAALVRRGAKKSSARLPDEVVSVLGRVPLAARQFAELVRVGNKLVLISLTPHGAEPLTEITDPAEIDRLVGLCRQGTKGSSTEEFDQIFRKLADETAPSGFLGHEVPRIDPRLAAPADVFAAYRGARSA